MKYCYILESNLSPTTFVEVTGLHKKILKVLDSFRSFVFSSSLIYLWRKLSMKQLNSTNQNPLWSKSKNTTPIFSGRWRWFTSLLIMMSLAVFLFCGEDKAGGLGSGNGSGTTTKSVNEVVMEAVVGQTGELSYAQLAARLSEISDSSVSAGNITNVQITGTKASEFNVDTDNQKILFTPQADTSKDTTRERKAVIEVTLPTGALKYPLIGSANYGHGTNCDPRFGGDLTNKENKLSDFNTANSIEVASPDSKLKLTVSFETGSVHYALAHQETPGASETVLIAKSLLGLAGSTQSGMEYTEDIDYSSGLTVTAVDTGSCSEKWNPFWGEFDEIDNQFNQVTLVASNSRSKSISFIFRVYDEGIGFRYYLPENHELAFYKRDSEKAEAILGNEQHKTWATPILGNGYEHNPVESARLPLMGTRDHWLPVTLQVEKGTKTFYMGLNEASIGEVGTEKALDDPNGGIDTLRSIGAAYVNYAPQGANSNRLSYGISVFGNEDQLDTNEDFYLPWKVVMVSETPGGLNLSHLMINLNNPFNNGLSPDDAKGAFHASNGDFSWIKPLRYIGYWWEIHQAVSGRGISANVASWGRERIHDGRTVFACWNGCVTQRRIERYFDYAREIGYGAILVEGWNSPEAQTFEAWPDANWRETNNEFTLQDITRYGNSQNVEFVIHLELRSKWRQFESFILSTTNPILGHYESLGINYSKMGYWLSAAGGFRGHNQQNIDRVRHQNILVWYSAKHKINQFIHEPVKQSGMRRTYPNLMSAEGLPGGEFQDKNDAMVDNLVIYPFGRQLNGPIEFTPGLVEPDYEGLRARSTVAKQLGMMVALYSPVVMAADVIENYQRSDNAVAFDFVKRLAVEWSESKVLDAEIGDYFVVARRVKNSRNWYIGGMNGRVRKATRINFDELLEEGYKYEGDFWIDGRKASFLDTSIKKDVFFESNVELTKDSPAKTIIMRPGGGLAAIIEAVSVELN